MHLIRPAGWRDTSQALAVALVVAALSWYFGADVWHSILLGGVLTTLAWIGLRIDSAPQVDPTEWRDGTRSNRVGARGDVAQLSRSLQGRYGGVGDGAVGRVRQIARRRLMAYQLDLLDPADRRRVEQVIGRRAYKVLVRRRRRPPSMRSLLHCLDVLDALDPARPTTNARPAMPEADLRPTPPEESP